jgi:hypothetical protein
MKNKILLAAPNSYHKNYCFEEWINLAKSFKVDIFIADNSPGDCNKDLYKKHGIDYVWTNPRGRCSHDFICSSQMKIRQKVLSEGYTHLFFLETDLFPPRTILKLLECMDLPVVSVPYFIYKNRGTMLMNQEIRIFGDGGIVRNYTLLESFNFMDGKIHQSFATGFGCCLIKAAVLEAAPFRWIGDKFVVNDKKEPSHPDSFFYADLQRLKIKSFLYTGYTVNHYNSDWSKLKFN